MTGSVALAHPSSLPWRWIVAAGVGVGAAYTLSPLTVLAAVAFVGIFRAAVSGTDAVERRWLSVMLGLGIGLRVAAIAALFAITNHSRVPFGFFFGDEELFIRRSLWTRNLALGFPVHGADIVYAYDTVGDSTHVYFLAFMQLLFGPAPYGLHLMNVALYVAGAVLLYRLARPRFGRTASLLGLASLLFLPSLFIWSISVLKEPVFFALLTCGVWAAVTLLRTPSWWRRAFMLGVIVGIVYLAEGVRDGGKVMAGAGIGGGIVLAVLAVRPRLAVAVLVAALLASPIALSTGRVQDRIVGNVREAAKLHWGHIYTRGYVYKLLPQEMYKDRDASNAMTIHQWARFVAGAFASWVIVPAPWQIQSRAIAMFWIEQSVWYGMAILIPFGLVAGLRRDPQLTCVLAMTALAAASIVALTSGNIGTLVRHRGIALHFLFWLSALGACDLMYRSRTHRHDTD